MDHVNYITVDVFTTEKFTGNPLAIVQAPSAGLSQKQKQSIAKEFNYSETTFVHAGKKPNEWTVDIFTTDAELPFAGHPTIGTACHLLKPIADGSPVIFGVFNVKAGRIELEYDVVKGVARASIPHNVHIHEVTYPSSELMRLQPNVGVLPDFSPVVSIVTGMTFVLVELDSRDALTFVNTTSYPVQLKLDGSDGMESFVACYFYYRLADDEGGVTRIRTRMIESSVGEDPATGSAACALACYLSIQAGIEGATAKYEIVQGAEMGRRSEIGVDVRIAKGGRIQSVLLSGSAVPVMSGSIAL